ncbi:MULTISPECIES: phosphoenolpyruvate carboxykinase domain-containing protein [Rhodococcus]|uniref:phosphoenolpyruvate carboxykinase domain-containing protein n=1 Tax=Rhodococcus TaxID=1827 RepID=UPI00374F66B0|nr:phosphoenolpyruvate carboxykinase domain-containing protein [Rhodococcus opacus]
MKDLYVNWFRRGDDDKFLWPGFGELPDPRIGVAAHRGHRRSPARPRPRRLRGRGIPLGAAPLRATTAQRLHSLARSLLAVCIG